MEHASVKVVVWNRKNKLLNEQTLFKHKIAELIVFAIIAVIAVGFVFNPSGTKDTMLKIYNGTIIEGGAADDVEDGGK